MTNKKIQTLKEWWIDEHFETVDITPETKLDKTMFSKLNEVLDAINLLLEQEKGEDR